MHRRCRHATVVAVDFALRRRGLAESSGCDYPGGALSGAWLWFTTGVVVQSVVR
jgi:hypothetical protein